MDQPVSQWLGLVDASYNIHEQFLISGFEFAINAWQEEGLTLGIHTQTTMLSSIQ